MDKFLSKVVVFISDFFDIKFKLDEIIPVSRKRIFNLSYQNKT